MFGEDGVAIASTPEDFYLINSKLKVDDTYYSDGDTVYVDPLTDHNVGMWFQIGNKSPSSVGDPLGVWRVCVTVYDETHSKAVGYAQGDAQGGGTDATKQVNVGKITEPTVFRVKLWANQALASPPASSYW
jgi:hypothetical protein